MNWYKIITADAADFLRSIGGDNPDIEQIIEYLKPENFPHEKIAQFYIDRFRENPNLTLQELTAIPLSNQLSRNPLLNPTPRLKQIMMKYPDKMGPWALKCLIDEWKKQSRTNEEIRNNFDGYVELLIQGTYGFAFDEIKDWYTRSGEQIDLVSMSFDDAMVRSGQWHRAMAGKGEGKVYQEDKIIDYGPTWTIRQNGSNPPVEIKEWEGWTIQTVMGENDLEVEGNKQNHCVGEYCRDVNQGNIKIFSLRDPYNEPHVTIETSPDVKTFYQIMGNSNSEPKEEYKAMIKHWVEFLKEQGPVGFSVGEENPFDDPSAEIDYLNTLLHKIGQKEGDEYGLTLQLDVDDFDTENIVERLIETSEKDHFNDSSDYSRDIRESPKLLVDACIATDAEKFIPELEKVLYEKEEQGHNDFYQWWSYDCYEDSPNIEDYESDELYDEEIEKWQDRCQEEEGEAIDDYQSTHLPFGFINDTFSYIGVLRAKGTISPHKPKVEAQEKGWYKRATYLTEVGLTNNQPSFEVVINDGTQYDLTAVQQVKSLGANPGAIIRQLVGDRYKSGSIITEDGFIYTIGIDNQGRKMIAKVAKA